MSQHVHHVPGRLRIRFPGLKRNARELQLAVAALESLPGVRSLESNPVTGSVLLYYDPAITSAPAILAELNIDPEQAPVEPTTASRMQRKAVEAVLWYAMEKAVERWAVMLL